MFNEKKIEFEVAGEKIEVSSGKYAKQATGSVIIRHRDTALLVTCTVAEPREGIDFFPLMVDFDEKLYSVGRIPGGFTRREGKASDKSVLISRLIDRPIRPLFPKGYKNDVQLNVLTLSIDEASSPDILALMGAAFALEVAGLPFNGPLSAVRVGRDENGNFIINPSEAVLENSDLDIVVAATADSIMMVEAGAKFVPDNVVVDAIAFAHEEIKKHVQKIAEFGQICGVSKQNFIPPEPLQELIEIVEREAKEELIGTINSVEKLVRKEHENRAKEKVKAAVDALLKDRAEDDPIALRLKTEPYLIAEEIKNLQKKLLRSKISETGIRADSRTLEQVRPLFIEVGQFPRVHGDGLFTRGDTQVLSLLSLGTEKLAKSLDGIDSETEKFYMHNYNFPAWSVGEVRPNRGPGRREIGHGALAERAIQPALPNREDFPYAIRVVSEVLESSGSTSMASTCASTLALMDGAVPLKSIVAGVAMGLIQEGDKNIVLTDIHELEDFLGDMDFKVAGDEKGISALQMDIKISGISVDTMRRAVEQAKNARLFILEAMKSVIAKPRSDLRSHAPRITSFKIDTDKIGAVIGPSGKNIKWIIEQTGVEININDNGTVNIYSNDAEASSHAQTLIFTMANGVQAGDIWEGEVVRIIDGVGAIVELLPGTSGLVHISQIAHERVNKVEDFLSIGDLVKVRVNGTDFKGRISLSIKAATENSSTEAPKEEVSA
jgi:polyribonucleotide nucleotidyltransferase